MEVLRVTEVVPSAIVFAGVLGAFDPLHSPYGHDHLAIVHVWDCLLGEGPISIK
jgi:hypothetical protein